MSAHSISITKTVLIAATALAGSTILASGAHAEYPEDPITFIVNYGAGSGTDMLARPIADELSEELGVPVNVKNRGGASGTLGISELKDAEPDGYTIGMVTYTPMTLTPHLQEVDYTPDDFDYFAAFGEWLYGVYVDGDRDWNHIDDVIEYARENPGELRHAYASHANALPMLYLAEAEDLDVKFVPTKGGSESESMVAGGHVDTIARHPNILERFESSEIRFLHPAGSSSWEPWGVDNESLIDLGYDIDVASWAGIGAPQGLPDDVYQTLNDALEKVLKSEPIEENTFKSGVLPIYMPGDEYKKFIEDGIKEYGIVLEEHDL